MYNVFHYIITYIDRNLNLSKNDSLLYMEAVFNNVNVESIHETLRDFSASDVFMNCTGNCIRDTTLHIIPIFLGLLVINGILTLFVEGQKYISPGATYF